jgi:hypothetical protein
MFDLQTAVPAAGECPRHEDCTIGASVQLMSIVLSLGCTIGFKAEWQRFGTKCSCSPLCTLERPPTSGGLPSAPSLPPVTQVQLRKTHNPSAQIAEGTHAFAQPAL